MGRSVAEEGADARRGWYAWGMKFREGVMRKRPEEPKTAWDPYAGWPDVERQDEFMETGNAACLTPELARKMQLSAEMMAEVTGVTNADLADARIRDQKQ